MIEHDQHTPGENRARIPGETTQDLRRPAPALSRSHAELKTRTRGPYMIATGLAIIVLTVTLGAVWHLGFRHDMPLVFVMPLYAIGFGGLYFGCMERLSRPVRENHLRTIAHMERIENGLLLLADLLPEELRQQFYRGYGRCADELFGATGTDDREPARGTANVFKLRRPS